MQRIAGVDVARGLAVLGMFTAHLAPGAAGDPWPRGAVQVADGRSAAAFVVLAGLSVALLSGGPRPADGVRRVQARLRVLVRGVLLVTIGVVLVALGTPVAVILPVYGVYFAVAIGFLGWSPRALLAAAAAVAVVGPPLTFRVGDWLVEREQATALTNLVVGHYYPAGIWTAYVLAGLAVGRLDLTAAHVRRALLLGGTGVAVLAHLASGVLMRLVPGARPEVGLGRYLTTEPHAGTTFEVVANTGVAVAVLAVCLVVADRWPRLTSPLAATGALALTAYTVHVAVVAALGDDVVWEPTDAVWLTFLAVTVVACTLWRATLGRGPLERLLHAVSTRASDLGADGPARPPAEGGRGSSRTGGLASPAAAAPSSGGPGRAPDAAGPADAAAGRAPLSGGGRAPRG
ncbi:heparan-alpha-glucosaminide N-acetyltransferase domain-containing protein [Cellulomonas sp. NPDC055163]